MLTQLVEDLIDTSSGVDDLDSSFSPLQETLRAIIVFCGNVAFALRGVGREIGGLAAQATVAAGPMSEWAKAKLPGVIGGADAVTGAVATALDTLAVYRYLGSALVAEVQKLR